MAISDPGWRTVRGTPGHAVDAETSLVYMQQRYYDPTIDGRFPSVDPVTPISPGGTFNRYWYANANPYRFTDPDGRQVSEPKSCRSDNSCVTLDQVKRGDETLVVLVSAPIVIGASGATLTIIAPGTAYATGTAIIQAVKNKKTRRAIFCLLMSTSCTNPSTPRDTVTGEVRRQPTSRVVRDIENRRKNNTLPPKERRQEEQSPPPPPKENPPPAPRKPEAEKVHEI